MLVKILGAIDAIAALALFLLVFGVTPWTQLVLFCAGLLFLKGLFIFTGEPLSAIDLVASFTLIAGLFFNPWTGLIWALSLLLLAKGTISFL